MTSPCRILSQLTGSQPLSLFSLLFCAGKLYATGKSSSPVHSRLGQLGHISITTIWHPRLNPLPILAGEVFISGRREKERGKKFASDHHATILKTVHTSSFPPAIVVLYCLFHVLDPSQSVNEPRPKTFDSLRASLPGMLKHKNRDQTNEPSTKANLQLPSLEEP